MAPYRASLPARILLLSTAFALMAGGITALLGLPSFAALSVVFLVTIVGGLYGLGLGIEDYPMATAAMVIALPFAMFAYALVLQMVLVYSRGSGVVLILAGLAPLVDAISTQLRHHPGKHERGSGETAGAH